LHAAPPWFQDGGQQAEVPERIAVLMLRDNVVKIRDKLSERASKFLYQVTHGHPNAVY
jgi:hypothetical protein